MKVMSHKNQHKKSIWMSSLDIRGHAEQTDTKFVSYQPSKEIPAYGTSKILSFLFNINFLFLMLPQIQIPLVSVFATVRVYFQMARGFPFKNFPLDTCIFQNMRSPNYMPKGLISKGLFSFLMLLSGIQLLILNSSTFIS